MPLLKVYRENTSNKKNILLDSIPVHNRVIDDKFYSLVFLKTEQIKEKYKSIPSIKIYLHIKSNHK